MKGALWYQRMIFPEKKKNLIVLDILCPRQGRRCVQNHTETWDCLKFETVQVWYHIPVILALGRQSQKGLCMVKSSLADQWVQGQSGLLWEAILKKKERKKNRTGEMAQLLRSCCSFRGPAFGSQQPQLTSICNLFRGIWCPLVASLCIRHKHGTHMCPGETLSHLNICNFKKQFG